MISPLFSVLWHLSGVLVAAMMPALALAGDLHAVVHDISGKPVVDAVVIALPAVRIAGNAGGAVATIIVDQINKQFVPRVLPVQMGTTVSFPNKDNIRHHVYSFSPAKVFELPLYTGVPAAPVLFDKSGPVVLGCNIHDWMVAYVYVTDTPYFGKSDASGKVDLTDLPAGKYTVRTWHPRLEGTEESTDQPIVVQRSGIVETTTVIGLKPVFRPRRAPIPGSVSY